MKKIDLKCTSCGATMQLSTDKTSAECPYCKNKVLFKKEMSLEEQATREEQLSYAREKGEIRANQEAIKKERSLKVIVVLIIAFIIGGSLVATFVIKYLSLEPMEDPFRCIDVKFYGVDGSGKAEIINNETCDNYAELDFSLMDEKELKEGQNISVVVSSDTYRFDTYSKDYQVTGLSKYLTKLDQLTDEMITKLHSYSSNHLKDNGYGISFKGEVVSLTPYKVYLATNGKNDNILYDVYKTTIKTKTGKKFDKYMVAYYEDFLLLSNKELFSYSRLWHCGKIIAAGDPKVYTANSKDYAGLLNGFETIEDFEAYINQDNDGKYEITTK